MAVIDYYEAYPLCLGNQPANDYIVQTIIAMIDKYNIDYIVQVLFCLKERKGGEGEGGEEGGCRGV